MREWSVSGPCGVCVGSVWDLERVRVVSVWGPCGVRVGFVWGPCGIWKGSMWVPCGVNVGSVWGLRKSVCGLERIIVGSVSGL